MPCIEPEKVPPAAVRSPPFDIRRSTFLSGFSRRALVQPVTSLHCQHYGAALSAQAAYCPSCGQKVDPTIPPGSAAAGPERILLKETAIAYRGWFDGVRMSMPFAGSHGFLALTSRRLVFVKGAFRGRFEDINRMNVALARRGGFSFALCDVVEASTDSHITVAIGGGEGRLAVRVNGPSGVEAHTFAMPSLGATYLGMDAWVLLIDNAKKHGGEVPPS